jgi:hypothetical protein
MTMAVTATTAPRTAPTESRRREALKPLTTPPFVEWTGDRGGVCTSIGVWTPSLDLPCRQRGPTACGSILSHRTGFFNLEQRAILGDVRVALIGLALAATLAVTAVASGAPPIQPVGPPTVGDTTGLTATLSTDKAGAKPVAVTLKLRAFFQCGQPGMLSVKLPDSASVPNALAPTDVLVNTRHAAKLGRPSHNRINVTPAHRGGVLCHVMGPGLATLRFTTNAELGNPDSAGTYTISVRSGRTTYSAAVKITG